MPGVAEGKKAAQGGPLAAFYAAVLRYGEPGGEKTALWRHVAPFSTPNRAIWPPRRAAMLFFSLFFIFFPFFPVFFRLFRSFSLAKSITYEKKGKKRKKTKKRLDNAF